jgi:hypothetical protein
MEKIKNRNKILVRSEHVGGGVLSYREEDMKLDLTQSGCEGVNWTELTQGTVPVMNIWVPKVQET